MNVLKAKTITLFPHSGLSELQRKNSETNLNEIETQNSRLISFPRRLVLELTNVCNLDCVMCGRDESDFSGNFLNIEYLKKLEHILKYIEEVTLFGWGEPTIHPKFAEILKFLNSHPVRKYFVTNGTTLHKISDYLFDYAVDIMAISLDGATAKTNNAIRRKSNFDQVVSELRTIVQRKRKEKTNYPYINFIFTLMKSNLNELPDMVDLAHSIGIEEVKAVYMTSFSKSLEYEVLWDSIDEVKRVFSETIERGNRLGIKVKLPYIQGEDVAGDKYHKDCFVGWRDSFIGSDGYIRPCQSISRKMFHVSKYDSFLDAWNSEEMVDFRSVVNDPDKMWEGCKHCYQSSHSNCNRKTAFLQIGQEFAPSWEV
jgi:radical SAM protein with 4Fe4S-binding SPASM domain